MEKSYPFIGDYKSTHTVYMRDGRSTKTVVAQIHPDGTAIIPGYMPGLDMNNYMGAESTWKYDENKNVLTFQLVGKNSEYPKMIMSDPKSGKLAIHYSKSGGYVLNFEKKANPKSFPFVGDYEATHDYFDDDGVSKETITAKILPDGVAIIPDYEPGLDMDNYEGGQNIWIYEEKKNKLTFSTGNSYEYPKMVMSDPKSGQT
eukprot:CAMPEP_0167741708 /NCGR_PEP_ID=MMETSP0110_2-20121227/1006_1 /TAXON_ID=629695 /ORGANISM="Gymnochlora sp., Strain CCMP2014" /LENGTH=201 /DNA_ID=CAMNT_0007625789 /DNA_START=22 /DNA_END=624 /DNA_ORIENTATION=+